MPKCDFLKKLIQEIDQLTTHYYIARNRSQYLKHLKDTLKPNQAIIILDVAENYSFIVQDTIHWNNSQATLHPFAVYYRESDGKLNNINFCIISDCFKHDLFAVHSFVKVALQYLTSHVCPTVEKIYYFTDGAASQYKNLINLVYHQDDFGIQAEWHLFATSHGKSACDGIGRTVKREAARTSLRATTTGHILTPQQLFEWCSIHITGIKFFYIPKDDITFNLMFLEKCFNKSSKFSGIRIHHCFIPNSDKTLRVQRISGNKNTDEIIMSIHKSIRAANDSDLEDLPWDNFYSVGMKLICGLGMLRNSHLKMKMFWFHSCIRKCHQETFIGRSERTCAGLQPNIFSQKSSHPKSAKQLECTNWRL